MIRMKQQNKRKHAGGTSTSDSTREDTFLQGSTLRGGSNTFNDKLGGQIAPVGRGLALLLSHVLFLLL
jgi:hypothetical protein